MPAMQIKRDPADPCGKTGSVERQALWKDSFFSIDNSV